MTYLRQKRQALEKELAKMVRIANRLSLHKKLASHS
jgi:hypothetical protein